jgi:hypothetical protein
VDLEDKGRSMINQPSSYKKRAFLHTLFLSTTPSDRNRTCRSNRKKGG